MPRIRGRIIRILDARTVIINLGREHGVEANSIFSILGEPEPVIDPFTDQELGRVTVVKHRVQAARVYERFTIATTRLTETRVSSVLANLFAVSATMETVHVDEGELLVRPQDVQPWKSESEMPVQVGDEVEVEVRAKQTRTEGGITTNEGQAQAELLPTPGDKTEETTNQVDEYSE